MPKTSTMIELEEKTKTSIDDLLQEAFERGGNQKNAAQLLGITQGTLSRWVFMRGYEPVTTLRPRQERAS